MGARLDAAEASLRETIAALDVGLRAHAQEAVAATQLAVQELNGKMHLLQTARGVSSDAPGTPPGFVPAEAHAALEVVTLRRLFTELQLRVLTAETAATEQKAERYAIERDLCAGVSSLRDDLARLDSQVGGTTHALGVTSTGLVQEVSLLSAKAAAADPWVKSDLWKGDAGPK